MATFSAAMTFVLGAVDGAGADRAVAAVHERRPITTLYGVSLGENASYALARLGLGPSRFHAAPRGAPQPQAEYRLAMADYGKAFLELEFDTRIRRVTLVRNGSRQPDVADPYGVRINDLPSRLVAKRGSPTAMRGGATYVYGQAGQVHWTYGLDGGRVSSISVSDGGP